jgi:hypothetical protein
MEQLPIQIRIQIMNFMPRRVHPASVLISIQITTCKMMKYSYGFNDEYEDLEYTKWKSYYRGEILEPVQFATRFEREEDNRMCRYMNDCEDGYYENQRENDSNDSD